MAHLLVPDFRKGIHNDTKDDVQTNCGEQDEEGYLVQCQVAKLCKFSGHGIQVHFL